MAIGIRVASALGYEKINGIKLATLSVYRDIHLLCYVAYQPLMACTTVAASDIVCVTAVPCKLDCTGCLLQLPATMLRRSCQVAACTYMLLL